MAEAELVSRSAVPLTKQELAYEKQRAENQFDHIPGRAAAAGAASSLSRMVKEGTEFVVFDAKTNEDITRSVLTQIIFEEEAKGQNLLPINFLRQLISYYGDSLQSVVPDYLEMSMRSFSDNQDKMREILPENLTANPMFKQFEEMGRKNSIISAV